MIFGESQMKLPIRHLSVRVPWHDSLWDGTVCNNPRDNASCMFLPRIKEKNVEFEEKCKGKHFSELSYKDLPPCVAEKATFMSKEEITRVVNHPYKESVDLYAHYKDTPLKIPPYSFSVVPFLWMMKDPKKHESEKAKELELYYEPSLEPKLDFFSIWVQNDHNQKVLLDAFASSLEVEKSLVFIYAKHTPLSDLADRVLIGVGRVTGIGEIKKYNSAIKNPSHESYIWERPVYHSIREKGYDGFILPYHEILERSKTDETIDLASLIAVAPNREQFSYGSEHVTHDTAIDALLELRQSLEKIGHVLDKNYEAYLKWIDDRISELWSMRGAFPGIGAVLSAMKINQGNLVAFELEKKIFEMDGDQLKTDPWDVLDQIFTGNDRILPSNVTKNIGSTFKRIWEQIPDARKKYLNLMSRMELNNEQAIMFYDDRSMKKNRLDCSENDLIQNPYLFYEKSRYTPHAIEFTTVDKAFLPSKKIEDVFPIEKPSHIEDSIDPRRVRALLVDILEGNADIGNTLLPESKIITLLDEKNIEPKCSVTRDIMSIIASSFEDEIVVIESDEDNYYKLKRLTDVRDTIHKFVSRRIKGKCIDIEKDWEAIIKQKIKGDRTTTVLLEKENKALNEKSAALRELARSRFSVLVGPAGTGKTKLLDILCDLPEVKNKGILKLAPTGKARVKLGSDAQTVAQFLYKHDRYDVETGRYYLNPDACQYGECKTVIIDEASMLTEEQLSAIIDTIVGVERFILVGDTRQLPPIGSGRPFVDIVEHLKPKHFDSGKPRVAKGFAELEVIFRQNELEGHADGDERIDVRLASWFSSSSIRKEDEDIFDILADKQKHWKHLKLRSWYQVGELHQILLEELKEELHLESQDDHIGFDLSLGAIKDGNFTYFNIGAAEKIENWQILSPQRGYGYGTKEINRFIQKTFKQGVIDKALNLERKKRLTAKPMGIDNIVYGDKVINVRNKRWDKPWNRLYPESKSNVSLRYIANGEIGVHTGPFTKKWKGEFPAQITFSSQPGYSYIFKSRDFENENESQLELAYSITVHKSQGSGFKTVILILPNPCPLLSRELLYTAFTRQENKVIILFQGDLKDYKKYTSDRFSETAKRITDLFGMPDLKEIDNVIYDTNHVQISAKGEFMISKSEVIIADHLFYNKVNYAYEQILRDENGREIKPDFTIEDPDTGRVFYWEHLGLLTKENYRNKWKLKESWYRDNGIVPLDEAKDEDDKILITTKDKPDGGIDSKEIKDIIVNYILA